MTMIDEAITTIERIARFWRSDVALNMLATKVADGAIVETADPLGFAKRSNTLLLGILAHGSPYVVSAPICNVLEVAAESLPEITLRPDDLPTESGYVHYERPIDLCLPQTTIDRLNVDRHVKVTGSIKLCGFAWWADETGLVLYVFAELTPAAPMPALLWSAAITFGSTWKMFNGREGGRSGVDHIDQFHLANAQRHLFTLLAFMKQRITETRAQVITNRQARKRALELNGQATVNVISLRQKERKPGESDEHHSIEWQCRWLVRGHWRRQYYPKSDEHRPRWIDGYVKGPEDKELVVKATAFQVVR